MVVRKGLHSALKIVGLYAVATMAVAYFLHHAQNGARGLQTKQTITVALADLQSEYDGLVQERTGWEERVKLMLREATERDIIEERARAVLGRVHRNDVVIMAR